ncbi:MAG TPA: alanine racemase [Acidimicrobiales bacterium]|nr:alanine racemase [Acidimicrobiales bacterium]
MSGEARPAAIFRPAWAEIDCGALAHNVKTLLDHVAPAELCAVVKADGYGHSAVVVAEEVLKAGATRLAVALVEEGLMLREAGIEAPILMLSEPRPESMLTCVSSGITPTLYSMDGIIAAHNAARVVGDRVGVHLKIDTGMHRVGVDPQDALALARLIIDGGDLDLEGIWTHLSVADAPEDPYTDVQIALFDATLNALKAYGITAPIHHLANSAAAITRPDARRDWVRSGIALYGYLPAPQLRGTLREELEPVLSLKAQVSFVRPLDAGERPSYGRRRELAVPSDIAVVPLGYADGLPRLLGETEGEVLIRGRRRRIIGSVTMDQIMVDCASSGEIAVGDEAVLLGRQGSESISAEEWAERAGTISYEILCAIGPRVPRVVVHGRPS